MTQPILVVDFGSYESAAAVVVDGQTRVIACPMTGAARWPSAACLDSDNLLVGAAAVRQRDSVPRWFVDHIRSGIDNSVPLWLGGRQVAAADLLSRYLGAIKTEAERLIRRRIGRLALTVPAGYGQADPRRELMLSVGADAGFPDVELISDALAAHHDAAAGGNPLGDGTLTLICDLGASWSVTLLRSHHEQPVTLGHENSGGGQDFDTLITNDLLAELQSWTASMLSGDGDDALRARFRINDFARGLKHRLATAPEASDWLLPGAPPYRLTQAGLERFAEPALRWLLASCRAVVARAGFTMNDVGGIVLVGGMSRLPLTGTVLRGELGRPVWQSADPELAVLRGAARWITASGSRRLPANPPNWRVEPLIWNVPDSRARLVRWLVAEGATFEPGGVLAQLRTSDDRVYDLTASRDGIMVEHRVPPGGHVGSETVAGMARSVQVIAGDRPSRRHQFQVAGDWMLTPDRKQLVECPATGAYVKVRSIATGAVVTELRPSYRHLGGAPDQGRVFLTPQGQLTLISWDLEGRFFVWDVAGGRLIAQFRASAKPLLVLVHEHLWRLISEVDRKVNVGRYRKDIATVWDLGTGAVLEEMVGEDLHRRYTGYVDRCSTDGFAAEAHSPDGRLRAGALQLTGGAAVSLHDAHSDTEVFRSDVTTAARVRTAFSEDGQHLLTCWQGTDQLTSLEIWKV